MSEDLSEDELAELLRSGRINTPKSSAKRRQTKKRVAGIDNNKPSRAKTSVSMTRDAPREAELSEKTSANEEEEPDPEWLRVEKEKAQRNIASKRQDNLRREEMQEASRF